jgi:hypothetical protein
MGRSTSTTSQLVTPDQRGDARETENVAGCKSLLINLPKRSAVVSASQIFSGQIISGQIFSGEHGIVYSTTAKPSLGNPHCAPGHGNRSIDNGLWIVKQRVPGPRQWMAVLAGAKGLWRSAIVKETPRSCLGAPHPACFCAALQSMPRHIGSSA